VVIFDSPEEVTRFYFSDFRMRHVRFLPWHTAAAVEKPTGTPTRFGVIAELRIVLTNAPENGGAHITQTMPLGDSMMAVVVRGLHRESFSCNQTLISATNSEVALYYKQAGQLRRERRALRCCSSSAENRSADSSCASRIQVLKKERVNEGNL